jgi:hypothetical protein
MVHRHCGKGILPMNRCMAGQLDTVSNQCNTVLVPCVAFKDNLNGRSPMQSTGSWPSALGCGQRFSSEAERVSGLPQRYRHRHALWYMRLVAVGGDGGKSDTVHNLVQFLIAKRIAFEIMCNQGHGQARRKQ